MNKSFLKLSLGLSLLIVCQSGWSASYASLPAPLVETLPNGLKLAWFVDDRLPVVDLSLIVKAGHHDDPQGKSGVADLVASSLNRGAGGLSASEISKSVDALGGVHYVSADDDSLIVGMHGLAGDAPALLDILGNVVQHPDFLKKQVDQERDRLVDRWSHLEDYGVALVSTVYQRILAAGTLYGRGGLAYLPELKKTDRADVVAFYEKHFLPQNSILVVIGRVDPTLFRPKIVAAFNTWTRGEGSAENISKKVLQPKRTKVRHGKEPMVLVDRPLLVQAQIRMGFRVPSVGSPDHYPLLVANALVGGYFGSRLNVELRDKLFLTYGINSSITCNKEYAQLTIATATQNETVGPLIQKITETLTEIGKGPLSSSEVEAAKDFLIGGFPLQVSTLEAVASRWLTGVVFGFNPDFLNEFVPKVSAVTPAEVVNVIRKHFDLKNMTIAIAGDAKKVKKSLVGSKYSRIRQILVSNLR